MKLYKDIPEGESIPKGYGVAWRAYQKMEVRCYPIPLNLLVRLWLDIYYCLMRGLYQSKWERKLLSIKHEAYCEFRENYEERLLYLKSLMIINQRDKFRKELESK